MPSSRSALIRNYLAGDTSLVRLVEGWIETVLWKEVPFRRESWDDLREAIRDRLVASLTSEGFDDREPLRTYVQHLARHVCGERRSEEERGNGGSTGWSPSPP